MEDNLIISFEATVFSLIKASCTNNEPIEVHKVIQGAGTLLPDIWFPYGCANLGLSANTAIIIKAQFLFDTLDRLQRLNDSPEVYEFIVITDDSYRFPSDNKGEHERQTLKKIKIWTISKLRKKVEHALKISDIGVCLTGAGIENLKRAFETTRVSLFIGAGVSMDAGFVSWKDLQKNVLNDKRNCSMIQLSDIQNEDGGSDIISGRYIKSILTDFDGWHSGKRFDGKIKKALYKKKPNPSKLIDAITQLAQHNNVESIISYNYDNLLEKDLTSKRIQNRAIFEGGRTTVFEKPLYHIHGYAPQGRQHCSKLVFSEEDYHDQYRNAFLWSNIEQLHALNRNTCIFIGLSMLDPNLRRLLDFSINSYPTEVSAPHYAFMPIKETTPDIKPHSEKVLLELGVNVIWYNEYADLPDLLLQLL